MEDGSAGLVQHPLLPHSDCYCKKNSIIEVDVLNL